ncbi:hypothetical protein SNE40_018397 [Patella caerulea]|uniref:SH3 domain-containing protein n=1 Tax=Patella caerulea TaxID=87958 RepID=A0AAN8PBF6_PATCE
MAEETDGVVKPKPRKPRTKSSKLKDEEMISDVTANGSRLSVDEILQQAVQKSNKDSSTDKKKRKKKSKQQHEGDIEMLEYLRKGEEIESLQKDKDTAILANTYEPDNSPKNEKSNRRKQKQRESKSGTDNLAFDKDSNIQIIEETIIKKKKIKKKIIKDGSELEKESSKIITLSNAQDLKSPTSDVVSTPEDTISPTSPEVKKKTKKKKKKEESEDEIIESPAEVVESVTELMGAQPEKKKKKKKKPVAIDSEDTVVQQNNEITQEAAEEDKAEPKLETPKKMKRKKKKTKEEGGTGEGIEEEQQPPPREIQDEGKILAVTIHRTDKLKNNFNIMHPLVRVHIVDLNTGNYVLKQHKDRAVTSYFETRVESLEQVLPVMTQPFDFRQEKSTLPVWEELLVFNENFNYFIQNDPKIIVFFELLDFVSMNRASQQYKNVKQAGGWHRIGWAFLKILGGNEKLNVDNKVRLQLFEPPSNFKPKPGQVEIYQWWYSATRTPYPSTLYVTLKGISAPDMVEPASRSMFPTQEEIGKMTYEDLKKSMNWGSKTREEVKRPMTSWSRLHGQTCRIPNSLMLTLPAGRKGCFVLKFSHDGRSLACGCKDKDSYPILVYAIPSGELRGEFSGHFGILYDLCWSKRDTQLLSASNDGTVRVWNLHEFGEDADKVLPHPSFVYTAQFHPRIDGIIVSGAFDQVIRVWDIAGEDEDAYLKQEIEDHHGHVNSVCFDEEGEKLYSADSTGLILVWNVYTTEQQSRQAFVTDWTKYQEIKDPELKDIPINFIKMHPSGRRLLVHCRDNIIRMFDLRVQRIMQNYIGSLNFREKLRSTISPCGSFVFAGSEDNFAYVWNTDSGDQVAKYSELNFQQPVTDIDYHPRDHIIAISSFGENQPVLLYDYNPHVAHVDVGISPRIKETGTPEDVLVNTPRTPGRSSSPTPTEQLQSSRILTKDQFAAQEANRYQKVLKKLDSVTMQMSGMSFASESHPFAMSGNLSRKVMNQSSSNWGTVDQTYGATPRSTLGDPGLFSPHAPSTITGIMQQQQFSSQSLYMKQADPNWRPGFTDVGRQGTSYHGRPPHFSMNASQGKAQFSFQAPPGKQISQKKVVAVYDYKAQRSDELSIFKGDIIILLYKDSASWWMGELANGQQGYFPSNYVTLEDEEDDDNNDHVVHKKDKKKQYGAVKTKDGDLRFFSATDDSDGERGPIRKSNTKGRTRVPVDDGQEASTSTSRSRRQVRLNESVA